MPEIIDQPVEIDPDDIVGFYEQMGMERSSKFPDDLDKRDTPIFRQWYYLNLLAVEPASEEGADPITGDVLLGFSLALHPNTGFLTAILVAGQRQITPAHSFLIAQRVGENSGDTDYQFKLTKENYHLLKESNEAVKSGLRTKGEDSIDYPEEITNSDNAGVVMPYNAGNANSILISLVKYQRLLTPKPAGELADVGDRAYVDKLIGIIAGVKFFDEAISQNQDLEDFLAEMYPQRTNVPSNDIHRLVWLIDNLGADITETKAAELANRFLEEHPESGLDNNSVWPYLSRDFNILCRTGIIGYEEAQANYQLNLEDRGRGPYSGFFKNILGNIDPDKLYKNKEINELIKEGMKSLGIYDETDPDLNKKIKTKRRNLLNYFKKQGNTAGSRLVLINQEQRTRIEALQNALAKSRDWVRRLREEPKLMQKIFDDIRRLDHGVLTVDVSTMTGFRKMLVNSLRRRTVA